MNNLNLKHVTVFTVASRRESRDIFKLLLSSLLPHHTNTGNNYSSDSPMRSNEEQPFIDSRAYNKANESYVMFPSQADAMLASLQLFHDVPCRIMDLIFSVVTHPDFDFKQVTLRNSIDVIDVVEESRLKDRIDIVHGRSSSRDVRAQQAGFPHFVLYEVLEILHAKRLDSVKAYFEKTLNNKEMFYIEMHAEEDYTLKKMSLVHRTWTLPTQKALGRILYIGKPQNYSDHDLIHPVRKSIFGPWTSIVAIQLYHPIDQVEYVADEEYGYNTISYVKDTYRQWFETLHRILVGFTNLKSLFIQSYASYFTEWSISTVEELVQRNMYLEEITLYSTRNEESFTLDPLIKNARISQNLRILNLEGARFSDAARAKAMQGTDFVCLSSLTIKRSTAPLREDLTMLSILSAQSNPCLTSLRIIDFSKRSHYLQRVDDPDESDEEEDDVGEEYFERDAAQAFTTLQCATLFNPLRELHIDGGGSTGQWFKWIVPYCHSLESLSVVDSTYRGDSFEKDIIQFFTPSQCTAIFEHLRSLHIVSTKSAQQWMEWIGPYSSNLQTFTLKSNVSLPPDVLSVISSTIQTLDLLFMTTKRTSFEDITDWTTALLDVPPSIDFSNLMSLKLFISEDCLICWQRSGDSEAGELCDYMRKFEKEMTTVCNGAEVECRLDLPMRGLWH